MLLIYVILLFFVFTAISEVKDYKRKAAEKREREEERAIIRKIKAEDKAVEDFKKYNIKVVY